jgi:hypothetical protein
VKKTYRGSCHCRTVQFECDLDLTEGTLKCNCTMCSKLRFWKAIVKTDAFRLLHGGACLSDYQFDRHIIHYLFCRHCGIMSFGRGVTDNGEFFAVNLACLDDNAVREIAAAYVRYEDGMNNRWETPPTETRHL